jgi:prepilin-type N-terminal cleavage/methylation domain-containing protein
MMRRKRQAAGPAGFTLIELMVVIAIIGVLTGLLVMTIGHMSRSGKVQATRSDLQNAKAMFDELSASGGMNRYPQEWLWRNTAGTPQDVDLTRATPPLYSTYALDFWRIPMRGDATSGGQIDPTNVNIIGPRFFDCLDAQVGALTPDNPVIRNGSRVVLNTQLAMQILLAYPMNKTSLGQLPPDRLMVPDWVSGEVPSMPTGKDGLRGSSDDGSDAVTQVNYCVNNCVRFNGATYRCIKSHTANSGNEPPPATQPPTAPAKNTNWLQDPNPTPLILDAWGNPIIFVPASGLINVFTGKGTSDTAVRGNPQLSPSAPSGVNRILLPVTSPEGENDPTYSTTPYKTRMIGEYPTGRPFFVSGGPDGDISTGDDNVYSFEK